jgi:putative nucleotidyltransferase with HDIG domain
MSAAYRFRQGIRALGSWLRPVDDAQAEATLSPALVALYRQMRRSERQHSLRVLHSLIAAGHSDPDLLVAALLHDVGKTRTHFFLPEKVLVVAVKAVAPSLYRRWGSGPAHGWRRPFAVSVQHPAWGAEMVAAAGGSPLAVELIRRHADSLDTGECTRADDLLRALQAVDDLN